MPWFVMLAFYTVTGKIYQVFIVQNFNFHFVFLIIKTNKRRPLVRDIWCEWSVQKNYITRYHSKDTIRGYSSYETSKIGNPRLTVNTPRTPWPSRGGLFLTLHLVQFRFWNHINLLWLTTDDFTERVPSKGLITTSSNFLSTNTFFRNFIILLWLMPHSLIR